MIKAFIDASVLFSAMLSKTGYARDLLKLGVQTKVQLVISPFVLAEVERNLNAKSPNRVILLQFIQELLDFELVQPDQDEVMTAAVYTALKDAPIIAGSIKAGVDYLVTYDRKHLLDRPEVAEKSGLKIVTPDVVVALFGSTSE